MSAQLIIKNCLKVLLISGIAWLPSCKDKTPDPVLIVRDTTANSREVLIANQGNFGWGGKERFHCMKHIAKRYKTISIKALTKSHWETYSSL